MSTIAFFIVACAVMLLLRGVSSYRTFLWVCMLFPLLPILGIVVIVCLKKTQKMTNWIVVFLGIALFVLIFSLQDKYAYVDDAFLPFWPISVTLGVTLGSLLVFALLRREKWWLCLLCGAFMCFALVVLTDCYIQNLNYLLDTSEPQVCVAVIEEKDMNIHSKGPDSYEFQVTIRNKTVWLDVSKRDYNVYEVGDTYTFTYYNGAFGKAFYMSK